MDNQIKNPPHLFVNVGLARLAFGWVHAVHVAIRSPRLTEGEELRLRRGDAQLVQRQGPAVLEPQRHQLHLTAQHAARQALHSNLQKQFGLNRHLSFQR